MNTKNILMTTCSKIWSFLKKCLILLGKMYGWASLIILPVFILFIVPCEHIVLTLILLVASYLLLCAFFPKHIKNVGPALRMLSRKSDANISCPLTDTGKWEADYAQRVVVENPGEGTRDNTTSPVQKNVSLDTETKPLCLEMLRDVASDENALVLDLVKWELPTSQKNTRNDELTRTQNSGSNIGSTEGQNANVQQEQNIDTLLKEQAKDKEPTVNEKEVKNLPHEPETAENITCTTDDKISSDEKDTHRKMFMEKVTYRFKEKPIYDAIYLYLKSYTGDKRSRFIALTIIAAVDLHWLSDKVPYRKMSELFDLQMSYDSNYNEVYKNKSALDVKEKETHRVALKNILEDLMQTAPIT